MRKVLTAIGVLLLFCTLLAAVGAVASRGVETERIPVQLSLPSLLTIAHVSDLHYPRPCEETDKLAELIAEQKPDCIVLTGDILDGEASASNADELRSFFSALVALCPCFLTVGNHEIGSEHLDRFLAIAEAAGVIVLQNRTIVRTIAGAKIAFMGLSDGYPYEKKTFSSLPDGSEDLVILLSHRPEKLSSYAHPGDVVRPDLVFAGHAHGGVARLGKASLYAPDQGVFPRYTSGRYDENGTTMIVSRGLGVSGVDLRFFNPYHLPVVTIS